MFTKRRILLPLLWIYAVLKIIAEDAGVDALKNNLGLIGEVIVWHYTDELIVFIIAIFVSIWVYRSDIEWRLKKRRLRHQLPSVGLGGSVAGVGGRFQAVLVPDPPPQAKVDHLYNLVAEGRNLLRKIETDWGFKEQAQMRDGAGAWELKVEHFLRWHIWKGEADQFKAAGEGLDRQDVYRRLVLKVDRLHVFLKHFE